MEFKGTESPWHSGIYGHVSNEFGNTICQMHSSLGNDYKNAKSNAKLIAAAPELLKACQYWLENFEKDDPQGMTEEAMFHGINNAVEKALK